MRATGGGGTVRPTGARRPHVQPWPSFLLSGLVHGPLSASVSPSETWGRATQEAKAGSCIWAFVQASRDRWEPGQGLPPPLLPRLSSASGSWAPLGCTRAESPVQMWRGPRLGLGCT